MDFQTAVRTVLGKYAVFTGRAQRSEFWWFALFNFIASAVLQILDRALFGWMVNGQDVGVLAPIYALAVLLPSLAVGARRLHDTDRSGWWLLLGLIPVLGALVLIWFFIQKGTAGTNQFGPDPLPDHGEGAAH
ncbi:Inner membrane protein YhaH [Roseibacterium elongatum DSM 19469]|uniref:Inner membrane protein YhaH n=1 Tax=Roseicyclus elongatus DSM 19469 TaxID=1294273 RepID=W8RZ26_9RHOB|nr:DUF805 domain-containing protein [Roseibacterium elongatum]AHM03122.1 Inner membrane protein YhaH [Roseibacterium elongatum DSM 19469]